MAKFWYRVNFGEGDKPGMLCGTSEFDLPGLMKELASATFLRLDELSYKDKDDRTKWHP